VGSHSVPTARSRYRTPCTEPGGASTAVVGVRHLTKNTAAGALASVLGSTAWRDIPRAVIAFAGDDQDDNVIHWQVAAGNRSGRGTARHFRIELRDVGLAEPVTYAHDLGASSKDVDDLLEPKRTASRSDNARDVILDILDNEGPEESDQLDARVAHETSLRELVNRRLPRAEREGNWTDPSHPHTGTGQPTSRLQKHRELAPF
jgi:hypothetical protein